MFSTKKAFYLVYVFRVYLRAYVPVARRSLAQKKKKADTARTYTIAHFGALPLCVCVFCFFFGAVHSPCVLSVKAGAEGIGNALLRRLHLAVPARWGGREGR